LNLAAFTGPADSEAALGLVMASAIAVTSIPVISRIMLDLGILGTSFATVVLSTAVVEDVVLYTVVAVALGIARAPGEAATGLPHLLGLDAGTVTAGVYYGAAVLLLFGLALRFGGALRGVLTSRGPETELPAASATTRCVLLVLAGAAAAASLGIQPMFGAFLAGVVVARAEAGGVGSMCASCRSFSLAFFLPLYFGSVGLKLDLIHDLDPALTVSLLGLACLVKLSSVYLGARLAGQARGPAAHLAAALNARGGPGIALATLTLGAGIIDKTLYTALIIIAVVTSLMAAAWLRFVVSRGLPLRTGERPLLPART
jgi:Kef-type K+ transport system membrane component KefB